MTTEALKTAVDKALDSFIETDYELLWLNVSERAISHKLAEHLQKQFQDWHVDCEYNRLGGRQAKVIEISRDRWRELVGDRKARKPIRYEDLLTGEHPTVFPDIIVHRRNTSNNLLVIEIKKSGSRDMSWDEHKLEAYLRELDYQAGLFLIFRTGGKSEKREDLIDECRWVER
jgi:hypothetical protein